MFSVNNLFVNYGKVFVGCVQTVILPALTHNQKKAVRSYAPSIHRPINSFNTHLSTTFQSVFGGLYPQSTGLITNKLLNKYKGIAS